MTKTKTSTRKTEIRDRILVISIFAAARYDFIEEKPDGRLLFWDINAEENVQFWFGVGDNFADAINLVSNRAYERGEKWGKALVRLEIKNALGL